MENVKGMLSSSVGGMQIFKKVMADLQGAAGPDSYRQEPKPAEFLVRAEEHGVPQARHRVIIDGLRSSKTRISVSRSRLDRFAFTASSRSSSSFHGPIFGCGCTFRS